jgi:hypothetical protein
MLQKHKFLRDHEQKRELAKLRKKQNLLQNYFFLRNKKSRNEVCRERRIKTMNFLLQYFVDHARAQILTKFFSQYIIFSKIREILDVKKRKANSKKKINGFGMVLCRFLLPMRRAKRSAEIGSLMRIKM